MSRSRVGVMVCYVMVRYMLCYDMSCYALLCMLCVMCNVLCYVMLLDINVRLCYGG